LMVYVFNIWLSYQYIDHKGLSLQAKLVPDSVRNKNTLSWNINLQCMDRHNNMTKLAHLSRIFFHKLLLFRCIGWKVRAYICDFIKLLARTCSLEESLCETNEEQKKISKMYLKSWEKVLKSIQKWQVRWPDITISALKKSYYDIHLTRTGGTLQKPYASPMLVVGT
jgi:hypothetical protein